jgi:hypothetical protein
MPKERLLWPSIIHGTGRLDLIAATGSNPSKFYVWTNDGSGDFGSNATFQTGSGVVSITTADLNGDGKVDLIVASDVAIPRYLTVLTNDGSGNFISNSIIVTGVEPVSVLAADVNGDGKMDLIYANESDNTLSVAINHSTFAPPASTPSIAIHSLGNKAFITWPSASPGWSLQQNLDLSTARWSPSGYDGYGISDDGTNKSLAIASAGSLFFRLLHP